MLYNYEIKKKFINLLPKNIFLFGFIDSCHSENKFDLPYSYNNISWKNNNNNNNKINNNIIMLSACSLEQVTYEKKINNKYYSNITFCFVEAIFNITNITWEALFNKLYLHNIFTLYKQYPIISAYKIINLKEKINL